MSLHIIDYSAIDSVEGMHSTWLQQTLIYKQERLSTFGYELINEYITWQFEQYLQTGSRHTLSIEYVQFQYFKFQFQVFIPSININI